MHQPPSSGPAAPRELPWPNWIPHEDVFAENVRTRREAAGLTQRALAQRLAERGSKLDQSAIARLERGDRAIRLNDAATIADVLGTTIQALSEPPGGDPRSRYLRSVVDAHEAQLAAERSLGEFLLRVQAVLDEVRANPDAAASELGPEADRFFDWMTDSFAAQVERPFPVLIETTHPEDADGLRKVARALVEHALAADPARLEPDDASDDA